MPLPTRSSSSTTTSERSTVRAAESTPTAVLTPGAGPLTWSTEAADFAASWAGKCKFDHSGDTRFGENLAAGTGEGFDAAAGFSGWANEACKWAA